MSTDNLVSEAKLNLRRPLKLLAIVLTPFAVLAAIITGNWIIEREQDQSRRIAELEGQLNNDVPNSDRELEFQNQVNACIASGGYWNRNSSRCGDAGDSYWEFREIQCFHTNIHFTYKRAEDRCVNPKEDPMTTIAPPPVTVVSQVPPLTVAPAATISQEGCLQLGSSWYDPDTSDSIPGTCVHG